MGCSLCGLSIRSSSTNCANDNTCRSRNPSQRIDFLFHNKNLDAARGRDTRLLAASGGGAYHDPKQTHDRRGGNRRRQSTMGENMKKLYLALAAVISVLLAIGCTQFAPRGGEPQGAAGGPKFVVDPFWPKPLKDNWIIGQVAGLHVDSRDHVWIYHRPGTQLPDEKLAKPGDAARCCVMAPPVMEFDAAGNYVQGWGGPGEGYDWPKNEHGLYVDPAGNVWVAGNDAADNMILKFTREGKFLMQIGKPGKS